MVSFVIPDSSFIIICECGPTNFALFADLSRRIENCDKLKFVGHLN
jgi:hypothetical protein